MGLRVVVYTAIYGGYDNLKPQPAQTIDCDFICFTDDERMTPAPPWRIVYSDPGSLAQLHPRFQAKYRKLMVHKFFPARSRCWYGRFLEALQGSNAYDYCIWIDGSIRILRGDFAEYLISHLGRFGMAMLRHPDRDCIFDEVPECFIEGNLPKYAGLPLSDQVEHYRNEGYPEHNGLLAAGVIVRDLRVARLEVINSLWWAENLRWSYQDQLSFPYVLWKNGYGVDEVPINLWTNEYFVVEPHIKRM